MMILTILNENFTVLFKKQYIYKTRKHHVNGLNECLNIIHHFSLRNFHSFYYS
jgi:hypothetical protein